MWPLFRRKGKWYALVLMSSMFSIHRQGSASTFWNWSTGEYPPPLQTKFLPRSDLQIGRVPLCRPSVKLTTEKGLIGLKMNQKGLNTLCFYQKSCGFWGNPLNPFADKNFAGRGTNSVKKLYLTGFLWEVQHFLQTHSPIYCETIWLIHLWSLPLCMAKLTLEEQVCSQ